MTETTVPVPTALQIGAGRTLRTAVSLVWTAGRGTLTVILLSTVVTSIAIAAQLLVGRELLDLLAGSEDVGGGDLMPWLVMLGVLLLLSTMSQSLSAELRLPLTELVQRRATAEILDVATEVDLEAYEGPEFHDRLLRARAAASSQSSAVVFGLVTLVSTLVVAIGIVGVLIAVAPVLVPIAMLGYIPIALVNMRNNRASYELEAELTELSRERSYLEYVLSNRAEAKEVRSYGVAPTLRMWHAELWDIRLNRLRQLVRRRLRRTAGASIVTTVALVTALSVTLILAARDSITIGDAAAAILGLQQLSARLQSAGAGFSAVHSGVTFLRDFDAFRATLPRLREHRGTARPPEPPAVLAVEHVGYRYPGAAHDAVRDVSFALRRGQVMAIVGANGSGKSTLTKVICGLLPPTRGVVTWDGVDLASCDPELVRAQIAPVFQDYTAYHLTFRRAIGLGDVSRMDDEPGIANAAARAGIDELIASHRDGLDTRLGKAFTGGIDISEGQWQRLAIARALFRDAPVVVLDEPSASLDPKAESDLFELLHALGENRIVIYVSHRFATVRSADVVMVLDQGEVVEMGTHDELMALGGIYEDLFTLQAERYGLTS